MDNRKLISVLYLAAGALGWVLTRSTLQFLHDAFYQVRRLPYFRLGQEVIPVLMAVTIFLILWNHKKANQTLDEVLTELKKVTWPNRDDVAKSTTVVFVCIALAGVMLAIFDLLWGRLIGLLLQT